MISAIFTLSKNGSLGDSNSVDWTCKEDKIWFKEITKKVGVVVIGRNTFAKMHEYVLPNRINYIITNHPEEINPQPNLVALTFEDFFKLNLQDYCVCGGAKIYKLFWQYLDTIYISKHKLAETTGDEFVYDLQGFKLIDKTESAELIKEVWQKI
jgi:dihydrofolate reductase